jgi:dihydrolipoamide dehydrogenase
VATKTFDVIILGGGPAGYVCAIRAAQLGLATAVVEREKLGGVCVNVGCIPSKALLHSAYVANLVQKDAKTLGVNAGQVSLDFQAAIQHSRKVSEQNSKGVEFLMKKHKVTVIAGTGALQKGRKVKVDKDTYTASKALIVATGTRVKGIPQIGLELDKTTVISTDEALFLEAAPKSVVIVGAGAVGCEFADVFNAFGAEVTLIEILPRVRRSGRPQLQEAQDQDANGGHREGRHGQEERRDTRRGGGRQAAADRGREGAHRGGTGPQHRGHRPRCGGSKAE